MTFDQDIAFLILAQVPVKALKIILTRKESSVYGFRALEVNNNRLALHYQHEYDFYYEVFNVEGSG